VTSFHHPVPSAYAVSPESIEARGPLVGTYSIVGYDPRESAWGVAIASRFLAVGALTRWGDPTGGIVVVQAHFNARNGAEALVLLKQGMPSSDAIAYLMAKDPHRAYRQMAAIDRRGEVTSYTGPLCNAWAGGLVSEYCAAQGNTLTDCSVVRGMVDTFQAERGPLAHRLVRALSAGEQQGGDLRGRQSASLLVVSPSPEVPFDVFSHTTIDLRGDDHPQPLQELKRLLDLHDLLWQPTAEADRLPFDRDTVRRLQLALSRLGHYSGNSDGQYNEDTRRALRQITYLYNLRRRMENEWIDQKILEYLEQRGSNTDT